MLKVAAPYHTTRFKTLFSSTTAWKFQTRSGSVPTSSSWIAPTFKFAPSATFSTNLKLLQTETIPSENHYGPTQSSEKPARKFLFKFLKWSLITSASLFILTLASIYIWYRRNNIDYIVDDPKVTELVNSVFLAHGEKNPFAYDANQYVELFINDPLFIIQSCIRFSTAVMIILQIMYEYRKFFRSKRDLDFKREWTEEERQNYHKDAAVVNQRAADLLLQLCILNKGAFVKAGQYIASLQYALPDQFIQTLKVLQDKAPFHSFEETKKILQHEFQVENYKDIFEEFDQNPIASASIAQVYKAKLKQNHQEVAVKIQHPNLLREFAVDLSTIKFLVTMVKYGFDFKLTWVLPEFYKLLYGELDFINEAKNCYRMEQMFLNDPTVAIPQVHWNYTTAKVFTMEFMHGCKINDTKQLSEWKIKNEQVAQILTEAFSKQIFEYGFINTDPHPGNLLMRVNEQYQCPQLVILDHGSYKELDEDTRLNYTNLWKSIVLREEQNMQKYTTLFGIDVQYNKLLAFSLTMNVDSFLGSSSKFILDQRFKAKPEDWKKMGQEMRKRFNLTERGDFFNVIQDMFEKVNRDFLLLVRTNTHIRGIVHALGKPINTFEITAEYCIRGNTSDVERTTEWLDILNYNVLNDQTVMTQHRMIAIPKHVIHKRSAWQWITMQYQLTRLRMRLFVYHMISWLAQHAPQSFIEYIAPSVARSVIKNL